MRSRDGRYTIDPYPNVGGRKTVLVTNARGEKYLYRQSTSDPRMMERAFIRNRGDDPDFGAEGPSGVVPGFGMTDVFEALVPVGSGGGGGDMGPQTASTSTAFTINGATTPVNVFLNNTIDIKAIVTFGGAPARSGEAVQFWAQPTTGGAAFEFTTVALSGTAPYTAENAAYEVTAAAGFASGSHYNVWAVYPGDASNSLSQSNSVQLNVQSS